MTYKKTWKVSMACLIIIAIVVINTKNVIAGVGVLESGYQEELYNQLDLVLQDSKYNYIKPNDNDKLYIGYPIHTYEYSERGSIDFHFSLYPLFYKDKLVFFITYAIFDDGQYHAQLTDCYVNELLKYEDEEIALVYDAKQCYLVSSTDVKVIGKFYNIIKNRGIVSEKNKKELVQSDRISFSSLSKESSLDYKRNHNSDEKSSATLIVPFVSQNPPSNISWAASVACIGNYLTSYSYTAKDVAIATFGSGGWNSTTTLYGALSALSSIYGITYGKYSSNTAPTDSRIYNNISGGYPLYGRWTHSSGTHATVIRGITTGSHIYVMDPKYGFSIANKTSGVYKYVSSYDGVTLELVGYGAKLS